MFCRLNVVLHQLGHLMNMYNYLLEKQQGLEQNYFIWRHNAQYIQTMEVEILSRP
jgi:hypothetical protein